MEFGNLFPIGSEMVLIGEKYGLCQNYITLLVKFKNSLMTTEIDHKAKILACKQRSRFNL